MNGEGVEASGVQYPAHGSATELRAINARRFLADHGPLPDQPGSQSSLSGSG